MRQVGLKFDYNERDKITTKILKYNLGLGLYMDFVV